MRLHKETELGPTGLQWAKMGKIIYAIVGYCLIVFMEICVNNRFKSSREIILINFGFIM